MKVQKMLPLQETESSITEQSDAVINGIIDATGRLKKTVDDTYTDKVENLPVDEQNLADFRKSKEAKYLDVDNKKKAWYPLLHKAYKYFPFIDAVLFLYPCQTLVANKLNLDSKIDGDYEFVGSTVVWLVAALAAVGLGFLLTNAMRTLRGKELNEETVSYNSMGERIVSKKKSKAWLLLLVIPGVYIISQIFVDYSSIDGWLVTIAFAIISLAIQIVLYNTYTEQLEAIAYYEAKKKEEALDAIIHQRKLSIENRLNIFRGQAIDLKKRFTVLSRLLSRTHLEHNIGNLDLFIGNMVAFQRIDICPPKVSNITFYELYKQIPHNNQEDVKRFLVVYGMLTNGMDGENSMLGYIRAQKKDFLLAGSSSVNSDMRKQNSNEPIDVEPIEIEES